MIALTRLAVVACTTVLATAGAAAAWWRYAQRGMTEGQLIAASSGEAVPCRDGVPECAGTAGGVPRPFVESVNMIGLPGRERSRHWSGAPAA